MTEALFRWERESEASSDDLVKQVHQLTLSLDHKLTKITSQLSNLQLASASALADSRELDDQSQAVTLSQGLPSPRLLRRIIRNRSYRAEYFPRGLFADPAWDMLLDLAVAQAEFRQISITSLCLASGVPTTTALRYVDILITNGLCAKRADSTDRRRTWIELTETGAKAVTDYFGRIS